MAFEHLLKAYRALASVRAGADVVHIGLRPKSVARKRRQGLTNSAGHPALVAQYGMPTARRIADRIADEPFRWGKNCFPGRYSKGFAALYTAEDLDTAIGERRYHLEKKGAVAGGLRPEYAILTGAVDGDHKDVHPLPAEFRPLLIDDSNYRPTQAIGAVAAAEERLAYLKVPSARSTGINYPVFDRAAMQAQDASRTITFFLGKAGAFRWTVAGPARKRARKP